IPPTMSISTIELNVYLVENWNTESLVIYLQEQDLKLDDEDFAIIRKEKINGLSFLDMTKEDFQSYGLKGGPATLLAKEVKVLKDNTKRAYSSYRSLKDFKAVLAKYGIISGDITRIPQFTPGLVISPQANIVGEENTGCVDYAIKKIINEMLEEIICITEGKQNQATMGICQNLMNLDMIKKKRKVDEALEAKYDYVYGIENAKLKRIIEENEKRDVKVEELEQKNIELETRLAILEQEKEEKSIYIVEQWLFEPTEDVSHSPVKSNDTLKQIVLQCSDTPVSDITDDISEQAVLQNKDALASDVSNNISNSGEYQSRVSNSIPPICSNEASASQAQNSYSDSSPKSHDELHIKQISESQSIPNTPNLSEESSKQNTDLQKTKIPEIDVQPLIEELKIESLVKDTVKVVNVDKNSTDEQSLAIKLVHLFEKISLAENNTKRAKMEEITSCL
ncbi:5114_t:CDS:2, partial [Ambispora gerdemannii]